MHSNTMLWVARDPAMSPAGITMLCCACEEYQPVAAGGAALEGPVVAALDASGAVRLQAAGPAPSAASAAAVGSGGGAGVGWTAQAARFGGAAALLLGAGLLLAPVATLGSVFHARRVMSGTDMLEVMRAAIHHARHHTRCVMRQLKCPGACSDGSLMGALVEVAVYGYVLLQGAGLLADGSELLLEVVEPGIIGGNRPCRLLLHHSTLVCVH